MRVRRRAELGSDATEVAASDTTIIVVLCAPESELSLRACGITAGEQNRTRHTDGPGQRLAANAGFLTLTGRREEELRATFASGVVFPGFVHRLQDCNLINHQSNSLLR